MFDAFTAGIDPGGLRTKNDIRILICYILKSVGAPLSGKDLHAVLEKHSLVNYFEANDALSSLVKSESVSEQDGAYALLPKGEEIADTLDTALPLSVRDKALEAAMSLMARAKSERDNKVEILEGKQGFTVICHISDGSNDMMKIELTVPSEKQAELVRERFFDNPSRIYELLLAGLTGDEELQKSLFS